MSKGWLLDYELHKAFCSPDCHIAYRKLDLDKVGNLPKVELISPELEITNQGNKPDFDWEKEGQKQEILYWRETVKELQRQLENSKQKPADQQHPNEIKHQQRQISYLLKLHQNTQQKVEKAYQNKYGKSELDKLSDSNQPKGKEPINWTPWIIGGFIVGGILVIGIIAYLLLKKDNKESSPKK